MIDIKNSVVISCIFVILILLSLPFAQCSSNITNFSHNKDECVICPYAKDDDKLSLCDLIKKVQFETIPDIYHFFIDEMKNSVFETLPLIATFGIFLANIVFPMIYFYFFIIA